MVKRSILITTCFIAILSVYLLNAPLAHCTTEMTWGTPMVLQQYLVVSNTDEIPSGKWAFVFQKQAGEKTISPSDWERMKSGDLSTIKNQIETGVPGSACVWIRISWETESYVSYTGGSHYVIGGFMVEALVKNKNANLTGLEIVAIIMAVAFIIAVLTICLTGSWVTFKVISATESIGPWATVIVGAIILVAAVVLLYSLLGGKIKVGLGKGRKIETSRGK